MRGLHIDTPREIHPPPGQSLFEQYFGFIVAARPAHRWLIEGGGYEAFEWPRDWIGDDDRMDAIYAQLDETPHGILADTPFLATNMRYLTDFWINIFGLPPTRDPVAQLLARWVTIQSPNWTFAAPEAADLIFTNVDGSFWQFFASDASLVDAATERNPRALPLLAERAPKA
jgi:hypothetical protein